MPTRLPFHVPASPRGMLEKAKWYVENEETHIMKVFDYEHPEYSDDTPVYKWYVLRKDNADKIKKLTDHLVETYEVIVHGASPSRRPCFICAHMAVARVSQLPAGDWDTKRSFANFLKVAYSLHVVTYQDAKWGVPECDMGNPGNLNCATSKGFKSYGIDSHVLAVNHLLGLIDIHFLLGDLDETPRRKGGFRQGEPSQTTAPPRVR